MVHTPVCKERIERVIERGDAMRPRLTEAGMRQDEWQKQAALTSELPGPSGAGASVARKRQRDATKPDEASGVLIHHVPPIRVR